MFEGTRQILRSFREKEPGLYASTGWGHNQGGGDCLLKTQGSAKS